jgi:hypothetical protein
LLFFLFFVNGFSDYLQKNGTYPSLFFAYTIYLTVYANPPRFVKLSAVGVAVPSLVTETQSVPTLQGLPTAPVSGKPAALLSDWKERPVNPETGHDKNAGTGECQDRPNIHRSVR